MEVNSTPPDKDAISTAERVFSAVLSFLLVGISAVMTAWIVIDLLK